MAEEFLRERLEEVHNALNFIWDTAHKLRELLSMEFRVSDVKPALNNYIRLGGRWEKQLYPIPVIRTDFGEVGVNLDGVYAVVGVLVDSINEEFLAELMSGLRVEIYGGTDFLRTFYAPDMKISTRELFEEILRSKEKVVQIEARRELAEAFNLVGDLKKLREIITRKEVRFV